MGRLVLRTVSASRYLRCFCEKEKKGGNFLLYNPHRPLFHFRFCYMILARCIHILTVSISTKERLLHISFSYTHPFTSVHPSKKKHTRAKFAHTSRNLNFLAMVGMYKKKHVAFFVVKDDGPQRLVQRAVFTRERDQVHTHTHTRDREC